MRQMKDSGIEWIGQIPEEWGIIRYKHVCNILTGFPFKSELFSNSSGVPLIRIRDITAGETETFYTGEFDDAYLIKKDTIIIGMDGDFNTCLWKNEDALLNQRCCAVYENKKSVKNFLFYTLPFVLNKINKLKYATTVKHLSSDDILNLCIPLPSLDEQQRIADYLDAQCARIDETMELVRQSKEKLRAYKLSLITEAVTKGLDPDVPMKDSGIPWIGEIPAGWKMVNLGKYAELLPGFAFSSSTFHPEAGIKLLRGTNLGVNIVRWNETLYYNGEVSEKTNQFILSENDMVIGMDRPWISEGLRIAILKKEDTPCLLVQRLCKICSKNIFNKFLFYIFISDIFKNSIVGTMTGVSIPHISANQIANCRLPLPPLPEQQRIAAYLDEKCARIDALLAEKDELLDKLAEYKKSLIFECVTGKREVAA